MPIKAATNSLAASNINSPKQTIKTNIGSTRVMPTKMLNRINKVVEGKGIVAVAAAIPIHRDGRKPKRAWRVLLDSGSDGNLIFLKTTDVKSINTTKRRHPLVWGVANGEFKPLKLVMLS
jgi:hypothetical protein